MKVWGNISIFVVLSSLGLLVFNAEHHNSAVYIALLSGTTATIYLICRLRKLGNLLIKSIQLLTGNGRAHNIEDIPGIIDGNNLKFKLISEHIKHLGSIQEIPSVHENLVNDEVGMALMAVQKQMKVLKEEEEKQHWITEGLAKFSEILRKKDTLNEYCASVIGELVKYVGANQGGLFLEVQENDEGSYLELMGSYAYEKRRYVNKQIGIGEGLLGQCMYEKDIIFLTDVPKNYVHITSGLGLATPRNIVLVPLIVNEIFYGAFELASFEILKPHQVEFLKKVSVMIASEISSIKTLEQTKRLTELDKKQAELNSYLLAIDNTIASAEFSMKGLLTEANNLFLTLSGHAAEEIKGKSYDEVFINDQSLQIMWENIQLGKYFSGEFKMRDRQGRELWMNGTLNPILDLNGVPERIMLFAQFTTQEKEKMNELNGMVQIMKQTLPLIECTVNLECKSANEIFMKMFGLTRMELRNKMLSDFMPDSQFYKGQEWKDELHTKSNFQVGMDFLVMDEIQEWDVSVSVLRDLSGSINRIVVLLLHQANDKVVKLAV